ncbi:MAG: sugar ABC transporter permease [Spirochaetaceae bacterium]|jgi:multiple sugar transport system permease protein|nr:sugar ABC transporter permease [Spirochaetaceae bacterium]
MNVNSSHIYTAKRRQLNENVAGFAFISPWLIGFLAFTILPMSFSLYYSFTEYDILGFPLFNGLRNFNRMLGDELFWKSLSVTFFYAFVSVPLRLAFAFFIALLFKRASNLVRFYQAVYYLPSIVGGSIAVAVMWRRLFMADGALNAVLQAVGINSTVSWIGLPSTAIWTLIILAVWQFGSSMLIFLAGLRQIPAAYYEAAQIDGANAFRRFLSVTLPQMTPIIFFNLIMQLINGFTVFTQAFVVSGGNGDPQNATLVYALYLYQRAFKYYNMGYSSAMAWVLVLIIAVFTGIIFKTSDRWVYYES